MKSLFVSTIARGFVAVGAALMAAAIAGCNSAPKEAVIPMTPPPSSTTLNLSSPDVRNNPKIPAFIKNGGLDRLHQEQLDHARSLQAAQNNKPR